MLIWSGKNYLGRKDKIGDIDDQDSQPLKYIFKVNLTQNLNGLTVSDRTISQVVLA
jgi:hypothetical protein